MEEKGQEVYLVPEREEQQQKKVQIVTSLNTSVLYTECFMYEGEMPQSGLPPQGYMTFSASRRLVFSYMRYSPQESQPSLGNGIQTENCQFWGSQNCQDEEQHSNPFVPSQQ